MIASAGKSGEMSASGSEIVDPSVEWRQPHALVQEARREAAKAGAWVALRITGYVALAGVAFQWVVANYFPTLPGHLVPMVWGIIGAYPIFFWVSAALLTRSSKGRLYVATNDGIVGAGREGGVLYWRWVKAFAVENDEDQPGVRKLVLYTSQTFPKTIALPEGPSAQTVIVAVQKHVKPLAERPDVAAEFAKPLILMTFPLAVAMLAVIAIGSIAAGSFMRNCVADKEVRQLIALSMALIGPSFWLALLLYGKKLFRREGSVIMAWVVVLNQGTFFATGLAYALL